MPFPSQVIVTLEKVESFSCPPGEFRDKMTGELKVFFGRKLQPEIWGDLQPDLWASVQQLPLFKQLKLMVNLKSMTEKIKSEFQVLEGKPLPEILKSFVNRMMTKDLCK